MGTHTTLPALQPGPRFATRAAFIAAGLAMAAWAPLVPYAKARVGADDAGLGLLLLCLGVGSIVAMPLTGMVTARRGSRAMILLGGLGMGLVFPLLAVAADPLWLGLALFLFGASLGMLDVAMNAHAVEVEAAAGTPLMSGFHGLFSIGGILGAGGMTVLLSAGLSPLQASLPVAAATLAAIGLAAPGLLRTGGGSGGPAFAVPRGLVLLLAGLVAATFLVEGAVLDWGALLLAEQGLAARAQGGLGYMLFAATMSGGRLLGDGIVRRLGPGRVLVAGGLLVVAGFAALPVSPSAPGAFAGFALVGLGASNIVPILMSAAGAQRVMPPALAVAAVTTAGYAGVLAGPAAIGFVARATSLGVAFWLLALLMCAVPLSAHTVVRAARSEAARASRP